ncbi:MAG: proton-conducting transporter membrane subunit, partial [Ktedonobacterales bacterium]
MALTLFFALLTLLPLVVGLILAALGAARLARPPVALGLVVLGALAPIVGVLLLAPDLPRDVPTLVALLGAPGVWFAPLYRLDGLSFYTACGIVFVIAPLLLWIAWRAAPPIESESEADGNGTGTGALPVDSGASGFSERDGAATDARFMPPMRRGFTGWLANPESLPRWAWVGLTLALALESVALSFNFADNLLWLAFTWLLLVALVWGLGELGSGVETLDWFGLGAMAIGPLVWLAITLLAAIPVKATRLFDLGGQPRFTVWHVIGYALALACAGGAYPFLLWVRRRASFTTPAGVATVALVALPATLLVGLRTYAIVQGSDNSWPKFSPAAPITSGVGFAVLGAASVLVCGLLALGRRDGRSLVALLAVTQVGWGLLGLGVGAPLGALGVTLLLATSVLGLGAATAALVAGGALAADIEPESAGPRAFGAKLQPFTLFAWCVGVASLVGTPLLAGFASQQVISAAALGVTTLNVPLVGIAWAGDALLALALLRATAAAFASDPLAHVEAVGEDTPLAADNMLNARTTIPPGAIATTGAAATETAFDDAPAADQAEESVESVESAE